ncbi:MAG: hypothetical protein ACR2JW_16430 [Thermomicrobiales bacterium]
MGLDFELYRLDTNPPLRDERLDNQRSREDRAFSAWLNGGNAIYRHLGNPHRLDSFFYQMDVAATRKWVRKHDVSDEDKQKAIALLDVLESDETRTRLLTGEVIAINVRDLDSSAEIFERPKDIAAAQSWVQEHAEWDVAKKRLLGLLDLLESDENLWIYESW